MQHRLTTLQGKQVGMGVNPSLDENETVTHVLSFSHIKLKE
jgi:hypothetical protein